MQRHILRTTDGQRNGGAGLPRRSGDAAGTPRRGGAVIILSLALLMTLLFLGLFFFNFIDDESLSADIYAKQFQGDSGITGNAQILNHGLDQVIVGTNDSDPGQDHYARYSALFGGRYSLLAHILGTVGEHDWNRNGVLDAAEDLNGNGSFDPWMPRNYEPYSGSGIRIYYDSTLNQFVADTNGDGAADVTNLTNLALNGSELAGGTMTAFEPNAGYTYPDLNALFLYHELEDPFTGLKAIKPSFDAPGVMYAPGNYTGPNIYSRERVLRPHTGHQIGGQPRYLTASVPAQSGASRTIPPFDDPANPNDGNYLFNGTNNPSQMGIWSGSGNNNYDLHVDADGDGVNDAWLLDLDYPLITFSDGRQATPLFFFKIADLDALVNLNSAGDMPLLRLAERYGGATRANVLNMLLSMSGTLTGGNFGHSPSEINPGVALLCDPSNTSFIDSRNQALALDQYQRYFNEQAGIGGASMDRLSLANTELLWLMTGRHQYDQSGNVLPSSTYDLAGRYGETTLLNRNASLLPAPGSTSVDDDQDSNQGRRPGGGARYRERFYAKNGSPTIPPPGVAAPPAVHPRDTTGFGQWLENAPGGVGRRQLRESAFNIGFANNPSRWPKYDLTLWQHQGGAAGGVSPYFLAAGGNTLQSSSSLDALGDEPDEVVLDDSDANFPNPDDQPFGASEITALHASDSDWSSLARTSRLRKLAPVNFEINYLAAEIRKRFTVLSWDRPEFGFAQDNRRPWEFNDAWTDPTTGQTVNLFPPQFGGVAPSRHAQGTLSPNDPLRPEVRRLLTLEFTNPQANTFPQHPLVLNGILSDDSVAGGAPCFDNNGNPRFRPLTPHPVFDSATDAAFTPPAMIHDHTVAPPYAFSAIGNSKAAQEWWARYDRQRLARDIYTLLWVLGSRVDSVTSNPYAGSPDLNGNGVPDVVEEMAQFAVNVVDAMDHDNVITRFEYDPDLSNGWSWTAGTDPVVHGVEAQGLTFSEALWINSKQVTDSMGNPADHPATLYDDASGDRHFLFIELRNALPFTLPVANDTYRIRRLENGVEVAKLTFDGALAAAGTIGPGENYLIGTHSGSFQVVGGPNNGKDQAAIFWLDHQVDGGSTPTNYDYYQQVPYLSSAVRPQGPDLPTARQAYPSPLCDLDLCHDRDRVATPRFVEATSSVGYFLSSLASSGVSTFELVLERRQNMQGDGVIADAANDWIEVDRIRVNEDQFQLSRNDSHTVTRSRLSNLTSQERREPFFVHATADRSVGFAGANAVLKHSLGGPNIDDAGTEPYATTGPIDGGTMIAPPIDSLKHQRNSILPQFEGAYQFQIVQPHFDRGFTSIFDLLSVPLIGPKELIYRQTTPTVEGGLVDVGSTRLTGINTAGVRFVHPQQPSALPAPLNGVSSVVTRHYENRWYRLFGVLAVPSHTSDEVADQMTLRRRIPGRVNLNTLRYEEVLGAVLNDAAQLQLVNPAARSTQDRFTTSLPGLPNGRNWYDELRRTRDGQDGGGNIRPPGTPYARPLRAFTFDHPDFDPMQSNRAQANNPVDDTLLRMGLAAAAGTPSMANIGLFEARAPGDVNTDAIDYYTKQRILSRISNLTTNRSHVFVIWAGFQLHEAHDLNSANPNNPQVQIGGRMPANEFPTYRELLVVDMSRLEEAYDPANEKFNFETFIVHREVLP